MSDDTRAMPHAIGPEKAVLSAMLQDPAEAIPLAVEARLAADHFYLPSHAELFGVILDRHHSGQGVELVGLTQHLLDNGRLDRVGGPAALGEIYSYSPYTGSMGNHIRTLHDKFLLRSVIRMASESIQEAFDAPENGGELLTALQAKLTALQESRPATNQHSGRDLASEIHEDMKNAILHGVEAVPGIPTGYPELDRMTGGLKPGEMIIIAARPSMGKTSFMMNIVESVALDSGKGVMVFSCEMTAKQVAQRMAHSRARVTRSAISLGRETSRLDIQKFQHALSLIGRSALTIDDTPAITIAELRAKAVRAHRKTPLGMIAVDYLQLMRSRSRQAENSREREISEISSGLKALSKELSVPICALAQLNRDADKRTGAKKGMPRLSDLRESGSIEQDADIVGLLHRDSYYADGEDERRENDGMSRLIIAKNRSGPTGEVPLTFIADLMRFESGHPANPQQEAQGYRRRY